MRNRLFISAVFITAYAAFRAAWLAHYGAALQARLALLPLPQSNVQYGLSRSMTLSDEIISLATLGVFAALLFLWLSYILERRARQPWFVRN